MEPKDRLKKAREAAGFRSASAAAKARREINVNTLISNENGNRPISRKMAAIYGDAFGVSPGWLLYGDGPPNALSMAMITRVDPFMHAPPQEVPQNPLIIAGDVAAGMWLEASLFEAEHREETNFLPDRRWPANAQYMVRVRGESLNKIAQDGDLLLCIDYLASGIEPKNGDLVIVERSRDMGATIERTAKRLIRHNGDIELRPESTDPRFQESVFYREGDPDHTIVTVKAKVISVVRPLD